MSRKVICIAISLIMVMALVLTGCNTDTGKTTTAATTAAATTAAATTAAATTAAATTAAATTAAATTAAATTAAATTAPAVSEGGWDTGSCVVDPALASIDGEGAELDWYSYMSINDARTLVWADVMDYVNDTYNMMVTHHWVEPSEYASKMKTLVASGMCPDVFFTTPATGFIDFVGDGICLRLNELFEEYMPMTLAKVPPDILKGVTFDGNIYAVVPFKDLAENNSLLYYKDKLDEAGIEMVKWTRMYDTDEMMYQLREWRDATYPEEKDVAISQTYNLFYRCFTLETYSDPASTIVTNYPTLEFIQGYEAGNQMFCMYDTPEFLAHIKRINQFVTDKIYPYDAENYDKDGVHRRAGDQYIWYSQGYLFAPDSIVDYECALQMQGVSMMFTGYVQAATNAIYAETDYPESCAKLLEVFNNDEYLGTTLRFGREGEHWMVDENGCANNKLGTNTETGIKYWYGVQIGDICNCILPPDVDPAFRQALTDLNTNSLKSPNLGFSPDNTEIANEISAVSAVCSEYLTSTNLYSGMLTEEETDTRVAEFVAKLKANGVETILTTYQAQLDEWKANN
ncbi:MAG: ABC transporter substrate-binding protein [Clostridiales bacterium]|nr:ABC transporter substrate-binding protein [Clostridiales bacterium]